MNLPDQQRELSDERKQRRSLLLLVIVGAVAVLLLWAVAGVVLYHRFGPDSGKLSAIGDMFGAIGALFSGWAFLGVIVAIILQYQELKEQRREIRYSREAEQQAAQALTEQLQTAEFSNQLVSLNFLIEAQRRLLAPLENPRTVEEGERRDQIMTRLAVYEKELARLIETEAKRWER